MEATTDIDEMLCYAYHRHADRCGAPTVALLRALELTLWYVQEHYAVGLAEVTTELDKALADIMMYYWQH